MNGFSESMLDELPSLKIPPSFMLPAPPADEPHAVPASATAAVTATTPARGRSLLIVHACLVIRSLTGVTFVLGGDGGTGVPVRWLAAGRAPSGGLGV